ncbi:nicotinate-nucleotide--dimethylbenzimidazole phosphoribosyltransferase [Pseudomarimonas salicorniae]|uniref:Nicotinate-nucleotide--dimethylbenzimidazole phosphoribosyltransferase n=1 Tax=Pseudomarimonas salicorniae TaxID=2933270 RepID=A0ABT0GK91_9GAMM|nr:nicotinate-nucleotide--dimethylbenzimidazole phosphoribosyltransferase [Lysobacter sp. CAU 1642]MCK7594951.1 nicotinate-nucleotide--dimethylbenzimidazole phosphoribosyltransferase [Lysobacter sp. CAU 1642]
MPAPITALDWRGPLADAVRAELDSKTKPPGSLGRLETLALQLALIQNVPRPRLDSARCLVFAADHGVAAQGVSPYPQAVTAQMVANFLAGGAAISVLAREFDCALSVVDCGVLSAQPTPHPQLLDRRLGAGTASLLEGPALSPQQVETALANGAALIDALPARAYAFGEMGIGNTTSAAALMHASTALDAAQCTGRGTGLDDPGLARKQAVVADAVARQGRSEDPRLLLSRYGGFEIATLCGAMLGAAAARSVVLVDGFIATAAAAMALRIDRALRGYLVFAHVSAEAPHARWLAELQAEPLLDLGLRLGEGSGAILGLPLLRAACALLADMATFAGAGVTERT